MSCLFRKHSRTREGCLLHTELFCTSVPGITVRNLLLQRAMLSSFYWRGHKGLCKLSDTLKSHRWQVLEPDLSLFFSGSIVGQWEAWWWARRLKGNHVLIQDLIQDRAVSWAPHLVSGEWQGQPSWISQLSSRPTVLWTFLSNTLRFTRDMESEGTRRIAADYTPRQSFERGLAYIFW